MITVSVPKLFSEDVLCERCKGRCLHKDNSTATQASAKEMFGIIPNKCVPESDGHLKCPYA